MKLLVLSILLTLNIFCQEKINSVEIDYIDGDTVLYSFESIETEHLTEFGSFIIVIVNSKGTVMKTIKVMPKKYENLHLELYCTRVYTK